MSGRGNPPQPAPSRTLLTILDQPWVDPTTGKLVPWAGQFLLRLVGYVGPMPSAGQAGAGQSLSVSMTDVLNTLTEGDSVPPGADAAMQQAVQALLQAMALVPPLPLLSVDPPLPALPPVGRAEPEAPPLAPVWIAPVIASGTTALRTPAPLAIGQPYFDTDLGIPIWWSGTDWVSAVGAIV